MIQRLCPKAELSDYKETRKHKIQYLLLDAFVQFSKQLSAHFNFVFRFIFVFMYLLFACLFVMTRTIKGKRLLDGEGADR